MNSQAIIEEIEKLPRNEQIGLYEALYPIIFQSPNNVALYLQDIREAKFAGVTHYLHCGSESIKGHGTGNNSLLSLKINDFDREVANWLVSLNGTSFQK